MKVLGITGGVGAGKSTVLSYMEKRWNAFVIQADLVGHLVQEPGKKCYEKIVEVFGKEILDEKSRIDRGRLAEIVFGSEEKRILLNRIVHPAVKEEILGEIAYVKEKGQYSLIIVEAALLLEDHYDSFCDDVWYIFATEKVRGKRLMESRGYTEQKICCIMKSQMTDAQYRERCKFVIDNSSDSVVNTYEQIDRGLKDRGLIDHGLLQHCQRQ